MLSFTGSLKVFVALDPIDMRKGFEGLHAAVSENLKADVRGGALFAFTNKKRKRHGNRLMLRLDGRRGGSLPMTMIVRSYRGPWPKHPA